MDTINTEGLTVTVAEKAAALFDEVTGGGYGDALHSLHIVGSALTPDFDEKVSDINSVIVLKEMDLRFVEFLAPLGKTFKKKGIGAPLIMTPAYIGNSLDVFPIEFFDIHLIHKTVYGDDIFSGLDFDRRHLRLQCEREIKSKLIWLRQGYLSSFGDKKLLTERLAESITGYLPLFRAVIFLLGQKPPVRRRDVVTTLQEITRVDTDIFEKMLRLKHKELRLSGEELKTAFEDYYRATEKIATTIDELTA